MGICDAEVAPVNGLSKTVCPVSFGGGEIDPCFRPVPRDAEMEKTKD